MLPTEEVALRKNGLIHLPGKLEDRNNYLPSNMSSFQTEPCPPAARCSPKFISLECAVERSYESSVGRLIKVMLLTIQIRAAGCAQCVEWVLAGTRNYLISEEVVQLL